MDRSRRKNAIYIDIDRLDDYIIYVYIYIYTHNQLFIYTYVYIYIIPVVPHKALAEVSKIGNL